MPAGPAGRPSPPSAGTGSQDIWSQATRGARVEGVALAAVGSFARREAGPLSDFDLVLLHYGRSLSTAEVTELADRLWYPIWDAGARLDHSVRTVTQCRSVASARPGGGGRACSTWPGWPATRRW